MNKKHFFYGISYFNQSTLSSLEIFKTNGILKNCVDRDAKELHKHLINNGTVKINYVTRKILKNSVPSFVKKV